MPNTENTVTATGYRRRRIAERQLHGTVPETLTAVGVWIVLPTIVGLWASSRREVK
jgi:hypothetical protein